jgi:integrase
MATARLTKRAIDALRPDSGGDFFVWDTDPKGFGVRVFPAGRKVFVLKYRPRGSLATRRLKLGVYGSVTVEQARMLARRYLGAVTDGADPARDRHAERHAATVATLGAAYLDDVQVRRKPGTAAEYERLWKKHVVPALGGLSAAKVTTAEVARLHRSMHETPYVANRVLAVIGSFFTFAAREGARERQDNPARGVEFYPERKRERFLSPAEYAKLFDALTRAEREGLPAAPRRKRKPKSEATAKHRPKNADSPIPANPTAVAALRLLALTGWRVGEVLSLVWDAIDFDRGVCRLEDTKTGRSVRPLSAPTAELLGSLPRLDGSPYVFPGRSEGAHLADLDRLWDAVRHAAGLTDVRLHDLRHSFASVAAGGGGSLLIIGKLLGHADAKSTQRYAHLADDPLKAAADRTAGEIAAIMAARRTSVTPIPANPEPRRRAKA